MVFQMPVMDYPESGGGGVLPYNHLRPYLYSHDLRFSYGTMKNRPGMQWQYTMDRLGLVAAIPSLEKYGFGAVYVNTGGTPDRGASLIATVRGMGYTVIPNEAGDLLCVFLHPASPPKSQPPLN
jgi:phosphoglycerol transferase